MNEAMRVKPLRSFTILELVVVIVIIGVLATLGVNHYGVARERAFQREAIANLRLMAAAERIVRMESATQSFAECFCSDNSSTGSFGCNNALDGCNIVLRLQLDATNWMYWADDDGGGDFILHAVRQPGGANVCDYEFDFVSNTDPVAGTDCL